MLRQELAEVRATHPRSSSAVREAFERLFREAARQGQPLDGLRTRTANETERFFANTVAGTDGHVYWNGPRHGFTRNDGKTRVPRRWWWAHVHGIELGLYEDLVPACGEQSCINPEHCEVGRGLRRYRFTTDQMLGAIKVAALRLGHAPTRDDYKASGLSPSVSSIETRFGNWTNALRKAGMEPRPPATSFKPVSARDCVASLRFLAKRLNRTPTSTDFANAIAELNAAGLVSSRATIAKYLGPWAQAVRHIDRQPS